MSFKLVHDEESVQSDSDLWDTLLNDITQKEVYSRPVSKAIDDEEITITKKIEMDTSVNFNLCALCNEEGVAQDSLITCHKCGFTWHDTESDGNTNRVLLDHNTSNNTFMTFNVVGKNSYQFQRSLLKTCSDYASFRKYDNKLKLFNYAYTHEGNKIPKDIIMAAVELFNQIKMAGLVFRKNKKLGVQGMCLYYTCARKEGFAKTIQDIAMLMKIEERFLSFGDKVLQDLNEQNIIDIPVFIDLIKSLVIQYFSLLKLPEKDEKYNYQQFVIDLIYRAEYKKIHIRHDFRPKTKCIGAIYMLLERMKSNPLFATITKDDIVKEYNISKSTFVRYYKILCVYNTKIKKVFKKHKIPMPLKWKISTIKK
jgi:hypothetical protein